MALSDAALQELISKHRLPAVFTDLVEKIYRPLAAHIATHSAALERPYYFAVNGAQGTGKSTMACFVQALLEQDFGRKVVVCSLDDLYKTKAERRLLADTVHPLLITRGVPGTHDMTLGQELLDALSKAGPETVTAIPRFDKAIDDRAAMDTWPTCVGRPDVIIIEGWCMSAQAQDPATLAAACNALEAAEDQNCAWRSYVNECLQHSYQAFFKRFDALLMLKAPSLQCVANWRGEQEAKLRDRVEAEGGDGSALMDETALNRFLMHYQRLTMHMLDTMPKHADVVVHLAPDHSVASFDWNLPV